jgi:hypothetical protein
MQGTASPKRLPQPHHLIKRLWAAIPFAVEAPFFVSDTESERLVAHLKIKGDKPYLFRLDLVGELRNLKP